jgi:uncharacterized membrane-anchored protein YjiN (DUF445 family)
MTTPVTQRPERPVIFNEPTESQLQLLAQFARDTEDYIVDLENQRTHLKQRVEALKKVARAAKNYEDAQTEAWHKLESSLRELSQLPQTPGAGG